MCPACVSLYRYRSTPQWNSRKILGILKNAGKWREGQVRAQNWRIGLKQGLLIAAILQQADGVLDYSIEAGRITDVRLATHTASAPGTALLASNVQPLGAPESSLTDREKNIAEALAGDTMTGQALADKAGYTFNSDFRRTLSFMVKRGHLAKRRGGYFNPKHVVTDNSEGCQ